MATVDFKRNILPAIILASLLLTAIATLNLNNKYLNLLTEFEVQSQQLAYTESMLQEAQEIIEQCNQTLTELQTTLEYSLNWTELPQRYPVNLTQFEVMDPDNSIEVSENTITWNHMDKKIERRVYTELSPTQQKALVTEFSFLVNEFTNTDSVNSRIVSLWMLGETVELGVIGNRSFTQLYAEQIPNSVSQYKLILHQRVAGPNSFVSVGPILNVTQRYFARIYMNNFTIMYQVSDVFSFERIMFESTEYHMVPRDYNYLMFSTMFVNPYHRDIWSSGEISDILTS